MKPVQAIANVELKLEGRSVRLKALVDTGASKSVVSRELADEFGVFVSLKKALRA